jgi:pimeloyl-ACP methyl ester carboxylesterase
VRRLVAACLLPLLAGCLAPACRPEAHQATLAPAVPPAGVVFVANGSGDFRTVSGNLSQVVAQTGTSLQVEAFVWSQGYGRYVADHTGHANHIAQGRRLAAEVAAYHQSCPGRRVYLIGHSAGSAVVLAAAEMLPPDSVERIILLAPSVCVTYDLRPALRTARLGIDSFNSDQDRVILGLCMQIVGTADHGCRQAAGRHGFTPVLVCPTDAALYAKLRQHPWDPVVEWSGNNGGHYGSNQAGFLRAYVLPLLVAP